MYVLEGATAKCNVPAQLDMIDPKLHHIAGQPQHTPALMMLPSLVLGGRSHC